MKTLDELFNEITTTESDAFKEEFLTAVKDKEGLQAFLKKHDCPATVEEFQKFMQEKAQQNEAVSDEELKNVSGGDWWTFGATSLLVAIFGCVVHGAVSTGAGIFDEDCKKKAENMDIFNAMACNY